MPAFLKPRKNMRNTTFIAIVLSLTLCAASAALAADGKGLADIANDTTRAFTDAVKGKAKNILAAPGQEKEGAARENTGATGTSTPQEPGKAPVRGQDAPDEEK